MWVPLLNALQLGLRVAVCPLPGLLDRATTSKGSKSQASTFTPSRSHQHTCRRVRNIWTRPTAPSNSAPSLSNVPVLPWTFRLGDAAGTVLLSPDPGTFAVVTRSVPCLAKRQSYPGGSRGGSAPKKNEVGQAERQPELIMGRTGAWGRDQHGCQVTPLPCFWRLNVPKNRHALLSPLSFVIFLDDPITFPVICHPWWFSPPYSWTDPSPKLSSSPSVFPCDYLKLSPNLLTSSPFALYSPSH